jgi:hypothetical protein
MAGFARLIVQVCFTDTAFSPVLNNAFNGTANRQDYKKRQYRAI